MELADLTVEVRDRTLARLGQILPADLDFEIEDRHNNVGTWRITLPADHEMADPLREPGAGIIVIGPDGSELFSGPTVKPETAMSPMDLGGTVTIEGVSDTVILADMLAWPTPTSDTMEGQVDSHDVREGPAETLMHEYVNVNVGPGAPASRRDERLTMGANLARGPIKKKSARFPVLGSLLSELGVLGALGFRVIQRGSVLRFETFQVVDRSDTIRLDIRNGTLAGQKVAISAPTVTHVIVAGQGEGVDRAFLLASTPDSLAAGLAWGRRIESWVDQRQTDDPDEYQQKADEVLEEGGYSGLAMQVVPMDDESSDMLYLTHWGMGDQVTVVLEARELTALVTGYKLRADEAGFWLGAVIGIDSVGATNTIASRVSALERNAEGVTSSDLQSVSNVADGAVTRLDAIDTYIEELDTDRTAYDETLAGLAISAWGDLPLTAPWTSFGNGFPPGQYRKVGNTVELRGMVSDGTAGQFVATLPAGFRPEFRETFVAHASAAGFSPGERAVRVEVGTDGRISPPSATMNAGATGAWGWLSLSGIRFTAYA